MILSIVPWGALLERPQQIASRLALRGHNVIYFNPMIYLPSSLPGYCKEKKISTMLFFFSRIGENLYVANVFLPPFLGKLKFVNEKLGLLISRAYLELLHLKPEVAIFYYYKYAFLLDSLQSRGVKILYECVDDHSNFPRSPDVSKIIEAETHLVLNSSFVTASSRKLYERISRITSNCVYVPNAADFEHFQKTLEIKETPKEIQNLQHPIIGFIGMVKEWIDIDLLCQLAKLHPEYSILLVGPIDYGRDKLERCSNISMLGAKKYELLPQYLAFMDICLIPFKINNLTLASNPIKLYEYLAAGKPVVSTAIPEVRRNAAHLVRVAKDEDDFIRKVEKVVSENDRPESEAARPKRIEFARNNSWEKRVDTIEKLLINI
jgi:glycosyltransferase involved in cell wall biosynthesis